MFGEMGLLNCKPAVTELMDDAVPYSMSTPHCPFPSPPKSGKINKMRAQAWLIEEVTRPTEWCAPMVSVSKCNKEHGQSVCGFKTSE